GRGRPEDRHRVWLVERNAERSRARLEQAVRRVLRQEQLEELVGVLLAEARQALALLDVGLGERGHEPGLVREDRIDPIEQLRPQYGILADESRARWRRCEPPTRYPCGVHHQPS